MVGNRGLRQADQGVMRDGTGGPPAHRRGGSGNTRLQVDMVREPAPLRCVAVRQVPMAAGRRDRDTPSAHDCGHRHAHRPDPHPVDPRPCLRPRGGAARPGLPDPAGGWWPGGRLHLGADAGPGAPHGRAPAVAAAAAGCTHCDAGQEQRALLHGRAGDLDGRRHHGGDLPDRDRRQHRLCAAAQRSVAAVHRQARHLGLAERRHPGRPALHHVAAGTGCGLRDLGRHRRAHRAAGRGACHGAPTTWRCCCTRPAPPASPRA